MKFGRAFSDYVTAEDKNERRFATDAPLWWHGSGRALFFATILFCSLFVLLIRLFHLTVISGHEYRLLSNTNRVKELIRHAPRGILLDRTGKPLVENIPRYRLSKPCEGKETDPLLACVTIISKEEGDMLKKKQLPANWFLEIDYDRRYLYPNSTAHIVGYTGEISEEELQDDYYKLRKYHAGNRIGRSGAEEAFEDRLHGRDGRELVEIDAKGTILRTLGIDKEIPGDSVQLSVDADLSDAVYRAYPQDGKGAVIVSKPSTGEILALYSGPAFSLNDMASGLSATAFNAITGNPDKPLFNRAISGVYPPGSTFKLVTAIAALEEGAVTKSTRIEDTGEIKIGLYTFPNWFFKQYGKTDGSVDIVKALERSNDIYFYKAGEALGITKLAAWARRIGVGRMLGLVISGEAAGLMPDPAWKEENFGTPEEKQLKMNEWYLGDTYHVSIGQGYLLTTPLQVNAWTNVIANGGKVCVPVIEKIQPDRAVKTQCRDLGVKKETITLIAEGMEKACDTGGTGYPLFNFKIPDPAFQLPNDISPSATQAGLLHALRIPVACKTGTAEFGDLKNRTHAWFTAFAPLPTEALAKVGLTSDSSLSSSSHSASSKTISGDPELSVTVLLEGAGEGSDKAAPIAKKIFETWFSR